MAGQEFGHHLGLPRALSGLPLSPLVPGYGALAVAQHTAGLRHLGEALGASPTGLRVLDGLYVPAGPRGRRRVDGPFLDSLARGPGPAAALAARMAALHRGDPQALRRVVLYQLICLLQDRPTSRRAHVAAELGVHPDEVAGLVAAARLRPALDRRGRDAAESLADAHEQRRLHRLRALFDRLPADGGDPALTALRTEVSERLAVVDEALRSARRAEERGDREAAGGACLTALGEAADDRRALGSLVRLHRPGPHDPPLLDAELRSGDVELTWKDPDGTPGDWRLLRLQRTEGGRSAVRSVSGADPTPAGTVRDRQAALGSTVRYAALPLREGRVAGPPLVSRRLLVAPEVGGAALTDGPGRIVGSWQPPAGVDEVTVERTGSRGGTGQLESRSDGFTATGLPAGAHAFRIVCHYRAPDGDRVGSPGVSVTGTVHPWPEPVRTLTARSEGGSLRFAWTGGRNAEVRLLVWPGRAPAPGTELRTGELPPAPGWPGRAGVLCPPAGTRAEVTAVAVLGARALAGPGVAVEAVHAVPSLAAIRLPDGQAQVTLDWPEDAGHLVVTWDGAEGSGERTLTAHAYRRGGLRLPVGPGAVRIRAATVPRVPGAVVVVPDAAETLLPPDTAVSYHLVRAPRRLLGRGRPLLRVSLSASGPPGNVPEFVCVARSGTLRPRSIADGTTVLRIAGPDLARRGTVEQELPASPCPAPYTLRGFLLGEHAALVRLEEPSLASLVVR
ncbi:hypothetical protein AB0E10_10935 [Streptomyces sp. NPDC048045]|uniref:hypothetical protein n=1 Tax=Streptomyces sp. NPDC048045 TaxID=3154710 RepID=UPI0034222F1E